MLVREDALKMIALTRPIRRLLGRETSVDAVEAPGLAGADVPPLEAAERDSIALPSPSRIPSSPISRQQPGRSIWLAWSSTHRPYSASVRPASPSSFRSSPKAS
jgi:hypothetical protein